MKKIIVISGSDRKNGTGIQTFNILKENFDESEYNFETIHLSDYKIGFCKGCTVCFKVDSDKCPKKDDVNSIVEKIKNADGLIFITPIYGMNISASLKVFLDRTAYLLHRPQLYNKHSLIIVSTDVGGIKPVTMYLKYMMNAYGINNAGSQGVFSYLFKNNEGYRNKLDYKLKELSKVFKIELGRGEEYQPSFTQIIRFNAWKVKNIRSKDIYPKDYNYWKEKGWLESDYYYPIKLSGLKKLIIKLISKRINSSLSKKIG